MSLQPFAPPSVNSQITVPLDLQSATPAAPLFGAAETGDTTNRAEVRANGTIAFGPGGAAAPDATITRTGPNTLQTGTLNVTGAGLTAAGNVDVTALGSGLKVKEGANGKQGTAVLVAGTVTVATTSVTASSRIFLTAQVVGGTQGILSVGTVVAGTSFVINSSNAADTSTVAYQVFEPG